MSNEYEAIASMARDKAREAIHQGRPVLAREWIEAAAIADAAGRGEWPPPRPEPDAAQG